MTEREFLTVVEAAAQLQLSTPRLYQYIAAGRLPASRKGGRWYIERAKWEKWKAAYLKRREVEIAEENRRLTRIRD